MNFFRDLWNLNGAVVASDGRAYIFTMLKDDNLWVSFIDGWEKLISSPPPVGAVVTSEGRPYVFFVENNKLHAKYRVSPGKWTTEILGSPPNVESINSPMGADVFFGDNPHVFVKGSDENLWVKPMVFGTENLSWVNLKTPDGVTIDSYMGTFVDHELPHVIIKGNNGNLWKCRADKDGVWSWKSIGKPSGDVNIDSYIGVIMNGWPYIYIRGSDGNLWVNSNADPALWTNLKTPKDIGIEISLGVTTVGLSNRVYIKGSDGNMYENHWTFNTAGIWDDNHRKPSTANIEKSMGAFSSSDNRPHIFIKGSDGNLWVRWWGGDNDPNWHWNNLGTPSVGVSIKNSMGAVISPDGTPYIFLTGSDDNLWVSLIEYGGWSWNSVVKYEYTNSTLLDQAIIKYAPRIFMAKNEEYYPSSVSYFQRFVEIRDGYNGYQTKEPLTEPSDDNWHIPEYGDLNGAFGLRPDEHNVPIYAFVVEGKNYNTDCPTEVTGTFTDIHYFAFFPYNRGKLINLVFSGAVMGNHVGDWEHVTVRLHGNPGEGYAPVYVVGSAHNSSNRKHWDELSKIGTHPVVYEALGSHGMYFDKPPVPGIKRIEYLTIGTTFLGIEFNVYHLYDEISQGIPWDTWHNVTIFKGSKNNWHCESSDGVENIENCSEWANNINFRWGNPQAGECMSESCELENGPEGPNGKWWLTDPNQCE